MSGEGSPAFLAPVEFLRAPEAMQRTWQPEEARAYGFSQEMRHFVDSFVAGVPPVETFHDGLVVNTILDACYASMKSGTWQTVDAPRETR